MDVKMLQGRSEVAGDSRKSSEEENDGACWRTEETSRTALDFLEASGETQVWAGQAARAGILESA